MTLPADVISKHCHLPVISNCRHAVSKHAMPCTLSAATQHHCTCAATKTPPPSTQHNQPEVLSNRYIGDCTAVNASSMFRLNVHRSTAVQVLTLLFLHVCQETSHLHAPVTLVQQQFLRDEGPVLILHGCLCLLYSSHRIPADSLTTC